MLIQGAIYVVTAIIALAGVLDFVQDERELRRAALGERPKFRKRLVQSLAVTGAVVLALLTWRLDRTNDREEAALRQRLATVVRAQREMDHAANAVAQARNGIRSGIETLQRMASGSADPDVRVRTTALLDSVRADYEASMQRGAKEVGAKTAVDLLVYYGLPVDMMNESVSVPVVVRIIRRDRDLNRVACAFAVFSELTDSQIQLFDFTAVERWCAVNPSRCA